MVKKKPKYRSSVKHFRTNYLFLSIYLVAKFDITERFKNDSNRHFDAFERMRDYFFKKFDEYSENIQEMTIWQKRNLLGALRLEIVQLAEVLVQKIVTIPL